MKLGLRIEVATLRGTRVAAPRLAAVLGEYGAGGTFLFSLGPDRTGRAPGTLPAVPRLKCYGARALLSGTLLPAADIGSLCAEEMRAVQAAGFEPGILAYDRVDWIRKAPRADDKWTREAMQRACERFEAIFGTPALTRGAPGWQMSRHAYRYTQRLGFRHCSDARGTGPFIPVFNGEIAACPQLPTTLPTLDELLARGLRADEAVRQLLALSCDAPPDGHIYALSAEVEGGPYEPVLRSLLSGWRDAGLDVVSLCDYAAGLDVAHLPRRVVVEQFIPGRAHAAVSAQGKEFLT